MTPWVFAIIAANVVMFFAQGTVEWLTNALAFVPSEVGHHPWTLVTYMFLHGGLNHLLFNMLSLYFFGSAVEAKLGSRRFVELYFTSGITGALLSMLLSAHTSIIGASGGVFGVMLVFARYWPDTEILVMFVIPMKARMLVIVSTIVSIVLARTGAGGIAHYAHLGGYLGAWAYITYMERYTGARSFRKRTVTPVKDAEIKNWKRVDPTSVHALNRDELNRILDKVNAKGLGSLTPEERRFLMTFVPPDDRPPAPVS